MIASTAPTTALGPCPVCATPQTQSRDFCFQCGTRFTCAKCEHRFDPEELLTAMACPDCGTPRVLPEVATSVPVVTFPQEDVPPSDTLAELLQRHLTKAGEGSATDTVGTVRDAMLGLASALRATGRSLEAAIVLEDALEEEGANPSLLVHLSRAALARELGNRENELRAALAAAALDPEQLVDVIERTALEVTADTAQAIESTIAEEACR